MNASRLPPAGSFNRPRVYPAMTRPPFGFQVTAYATSFSELPNWRPLIVGVEALLLLNDGEPPGSLRIDHERVTEESASAIENDWVPSSCPVPTVEFQGHP